jgi:predicted Zn-dependent protease
VHSLFRDLATYAFSLLHGQEVLLLNFDGEDTAFVRLNHSAIRQTGHVRRYRLQLTLIESARQASAEFDLSSDAEQDRRQVRACLDGLRERLPLLPVDPFLQYATDAPDTFDQQIGDYPDARDAVHSVIASARGLDLVGLWASGEMTSGYASSLGQFNWHSLNSFNLDWSLYDHGDKAVKLDYADVAWQRGELTRRMEAGRETMAVLGRPATELAPGRYRAYLSPVALYQLLVLLGRDGFGEKSHRTAHTPLLAMIRTGATLDTRVSMTEQHAGGLTPPFTRAGFIKPERVELIHAGVYRGCLAGPRSAVEYGTAVNCDLERAQSLEMAAGDLPMESIADELGTGLLVSNLWYCNYSDRSHCRITGMTRFSCLWVEEGRVVAPANVMRFDDTLYNILGGGLRALTRERERIFDSTTYGGRSRDSARLPGALVEGFALTL